MDELTRHLEEHDKKKEPIELKELKREVKYLRLELDVIKGEFKELKKALT